jgi:hypothetical protein
MYSVNRSSLGILNDVKYDVNDDVKWLYLRLTLVVIIFLIIDK